MAESGPGLQSRGILTALRAAAMLIIATGLNDVIAGAVPRFEPLYVYLAAIALVVWLDGIILGTFTALGAIAFYALLFMPRADALSIAVLMPLLAALGVVIVVGLARGLVRARRRAPPVVVPRVHVQSLLAPPPVAMNNSDVLLAIDALRNELRERETVLESAAAEARETLVARVHLAEEENARLVRVLDGERAEKMHLETAARDYEHSTRQAFADQHALRERTTALEQELADARAARERHVQTLADLARRHEETERAWRESVAMLEGSLADTARTHEEAERALRHRIATLEGSLHAATETLADQHALRERTTTLEHELADARAARARQAQSLADLARTHDEAERALRDRITILEASLTTASASHADKAAALAENEAALVDKEAALADKVAALADKAAALDQAHVETRGLMSRIHALVTQAASAEQARIAASAELERARSEARDLASRVAELEQARVAASAEFDEKLQTITTHLAQDHEADLGKAIEAREEARAEARGLASRIHTLEEQLTHAAQTLSDERALRERLEVDASTRDAETETLRSRIGELEQALAEVAGAQGDTERSYMDRIAALETAGAEAARLNDYVAIVEEQLQHANADAASLRMRIGEAEETATVAAAEARGLLLRVHELEEELRQASSAFDEKLNTIVAHLAEDHEADLGKALEDKEEARAEVRSLTLRLSTLQKKFDEERQVVTAAAQREIDRLRTRLSEIEKARGGPLLYGAVRPRVLIAHPDADLRMSARASLERAGYEILSAGDGLEALRTANAERPDVVIADAVMPKMDGRELCQLLKSQEKTAHIRVILLTRAIDEPSKGDLPPDGILRKPVPLEMLKSTLAALLKPT